MSNNFDNAPADVMQVKNEQVDDDQIDDEEVEARAIFYNRPEVARSLYRYLKRTQPGLGLPKEESVARMNAVITMHCSYDLPPVEHPDILEVLVTILSPNVTLTNKKRMARITSKRIKDACQLGTAYMERAMAKFESSEDTARPTTPTEKPRRRRASLSPGTPTSRHRHKRPSTGCAGSFAASSDSPELRKSGDAVTDQSMTDPYSVSGSTDLVSLL
ncbi:hypothetical protein EV127DRAFT_183097 [Xylaria flabelliformis]|nr:hypothetical protein EV127DRAFT_183097 [Xylaria flabelliformis]